MTFVSAEEQWKFGVIEKFLEYEVRKDQVPEELGEVPEYNPGKRARRNPGKKWNGRWKKNPHRNAPGKQAQGNNTENNNRRYKKRPDSPAKSQNKTNNPT